MLCVPVTYDVVPCSTCRPACDRLFAGLVPHVVHPSGSRQSAFLFSAVSVLPTPAYHAGLICPLSRYFATSCHGWYVIQFDTAFSAKPTSISSLLLRAELHLAVPML